MPWPKGLKRTNAQRSTMKKNLEQARIEKLEAEVARLSKLQGDSERDLTDEEIQARFQTRLKWKTCDGRLVDNLWLYAHAHELTQADAEMFVKCRADNRHLHVVLASMTRMFRKEYIARRTRKTGKDITGWSTADKAERYWRGCARLWLEILAECGFTLSQIFDAIEDLTPRNMDYPRPAMIAGQWGGRIKSWLPVDEREDQEETKLWMDDDGNVWVDNSGPDGYGIEAVYGLPEKGGPAHPSLSQLRRERDERRAKGIILTSEQKKLSEST